MCERSVGRNCGVNGHAGVPQLSTTDSLASFEQLCESTPTVNVGLPQPLQSPQQPRLFRRSHSDRTMDQYSAEAIPRTEGKDMADAKGASHENFAHSASTAMSDGAHHPRQGTAQPAAASAVHAMGERHAMLDQPTLNIGFIGHVAHGKSTLQKALSFKRTQQHRLEMKSNKTIKLGYSSAKIYRCNDAACAAPGCYQAGPSNASKAPKCATCGGPSHMVRHVSFVDCPGHDALMATMLNGAAVMDAAILVVAANEPCPQPQTAEHLNVMDVMGMKHMVVVQNKVGLCVCVCVCVCAIESRRRMAHNCHVLLCCRPGIAMLQTELVTPEGARESLSQIKAFVKGTCAEGAPVIPAAAQLGINADAVAAWIAQLPDKPQRHSVSKAAAAKEARGDAARMLVVRSFDVNKPGADITQMVGGVAGGSIVNGSISVGQVHQVAALHARASTIVIVWLCVWLCW